MPSAVRQRCPIGSGSITEIDRYRGNRSGVVIIFIGACITRSGIGIDAVKWEQPGIRMRGFTLLEVTIALLIAGMAGMVLLEAAGSGLRQTKTASMYDQAVVRAKSRHVLVDC